MNTESSSTDDQMKRALLKERYLKFLTKLSGCETTIEMCENTTVKATIKAVQPSSDHVIVSNLQTKIGILDKAVLRAVDIIKISVNAEELSK